jgi:hypothetical protein
MVIDGPALVDRERAAESGRLRRREPADHALGRPEQFGQIDEWKLGARLEAGRAQDCHSLCTRDGILEQRCLADPRIAQYEERTTASAPRLVEERLKRSALALPADQHCPILIDRSPET